MAAGLSLLLLAPLLAGHLEPLGARVPFLSSHDGQTALAGGSTSWGLLIVDDDGVARRVCEESTGAPATMHLPLGDGRVLAIAGGQLVVTSDRGCSWHTAVVPAGAEVHDSVVDDRGRVWAAAGRQGFPSGLLVSVDDGDTFQPSSFWSGPSPLFDVDSGAGRVWASGFDIDLEGPFVVVGNTDGSDGPDVVIEILPADFSRYQAVRVVGVDGVGHGLAVGLLGSGASEVLVLDDVGETPVTVIGEVPLPATHVAVLGPDALGPDADIFAVVTPGQLWHREGNQLVAVADVRARCVVADEQDGLWLCGHSTGLLGGVHFAHSSDRGQTFTTVVADDAIDQRHCPADTIGGVVCARYLDGEGPTDPVGPVDPVDPVDPGDPARPGDPDTRDPDDITGAESGDTDATDGGCHSAGLPLAQVLLCLLARRRRR
jgi:hypothetical protein